MKLVSFGRRSRVAAQEPLGPLEAALQPAWVDGRWRVPDRFNFTRDVVEVLAEESRRRALMFLGTDGVIDPWTFQRLAEGAGFWAARLREHGVRPGDRVVVVVGKTPSWIEVMLAGMKIGAVTVPCSPDLPRAALGVRVASSGAKVVVAERSAAAEALENGERAAVLYVDEAHDRLQRMSGEEPTHDTQAKDLAFLLTTSGAGGGPYGVEHTHAAAFAARAQAEHWLDARRGDVVWCTADTSSPLSVWLLLLGPWARGAEVVLHEGQFDAEERLDLIRRFEVTILCQSPSEYRALAETGERTLGRYLPDRLRRMVSVGDFLSSDVVSTFEQAWGLPIEDGWAQAECGVAIGHGSDDGLESGSIGHPLPGYDVAIVDENGAELPAGADGQLALRGRPPTLFTGYWNAPEQTKAVLRGDLYMTGDLACRNEDGSVRLLGRARDVVTSGGRRFSPFEIEQALVGHRAVSNAGVVGVRDLQRGGQYVRAFVVLVPGEAGSDRLVAEIRQHLRHTLPEDKVPREVEFVDALPTTASGTILRSELRDRTTVAVEGVWAKAPRLPGTPAPVPTPEPPPSRAVVTEVEDEGPLPDFVVPRSKTYAASLADFDAEPAAELEPDDEELPDYVVVPELVPEPLPEHVVSFLNAAPLPDIPVEHEEATAARPEARPEPRTVPILQAESEAATATGPEEPGRAPVSEVPAEPKPQTEPKTKPRTRPIREPEPASPPPTARVPSPAKPKPAAAKSPPPSPSPSTSKPVAAEKPPESPKPPSKPAAKKPVAKAAAPVKARVPEPDVVPPPTPDPVPKPAPEPSPAPPAPAPPPAPTPAPRPPPADPPAQRKVAPKRAPAVSVEPENGEPKRRGRRKRREKQPAQVAKQEARERSAPEPGMENPDIAFIKTLSSRLDAYSIAVDKPASAKEPEPD